MVIFPARLAVVVTEMQAQLQLLECLLQTVQG